MIVIENRRLWETNQSYSVDGKLLTITVEEYTESFDLNMEPGEYYLEDCLVLPYNPFEKIVIGEEITVHLFYDNPYEYIEDYVIPFDRAGVIFSSGSFNKESKLIEIEEAFNNNLANGSFYSEAMGIDVDCRRSGTRNDKQNVEGLIELFDALPIEKRYYKGVSETTSEPFTIEQLQALKIEMANYALQLYEKKWYLEELVAVALTIEELEAIQWI